MAPFLEAAAGVIKAAEIAETAVKGAEKVLEGAKALGRLSSDAVGKAAEGTEKAADAAETGGKILGKIRLPEDLPLPKLDKLGLPDDLEMFKLELPRDLEDLSNGGAAARETAEKQSQAEKTEKKPDPEATEKKPAPSKDAKPEETGDDKRETESDSPERKIEHPIECIFKCPEGCDKDEFGRQLKEQEKGLNDMTVDEFLKNREKYKQDGREGGDAQKRARQEARAEKIEEYRKQGMSRQEAEARADEWLKDKAALHSPDQIAGGDPQKITGMGDSTVNSSIGAQWGAGRAEQLEQKVRDYIKANDIPPADLDKIKMNVNLNVA